MPDQTITILKNDHKALIDAFDRVNKAGINTPQGKAHLQQAKEILIQHLKREDESIYFDILKMSERHKHLKSVMTDFSREMTGLTKSITEFFSKVASGASGVELAMEFGRLFGAVKTRIRKEEVALYEEYLKCKNMEATRAA